MVKRALIIMARQPQPGQVKTRLCPPLTPVGAADLYTAFLEDMIDKVAALAPITPALAFTPPAGAAYFAGLAPDFERVVQSGRSLSQRLDGVLRHFLNAGYQHVAACSSDSPTLPPTYLAAAFERLADPAVDVIFGPCHDGGYYLIGVKRLPPTLVRQVQMSTPHVLADSLAAATAAGLRPALLPAWYDIDSAADLARLRQELVQAPHQAPATAACLARPLGM